MGVGGWEGGGGEVGGEVDLLQTHLELRCVVRMRMQAGVYPQNGELKGEVEAL